VSTLGSGAKRWNEIFCTNATINTSDGRDKVDVEEISAAEKKVAVKLKRALKNFRWRDAVDKKGYLARIHVGIVAQEVEKAFESEGLNAGCYGLFCCDVDEDGTVRYGVRYSELHSFILAAI
jgi:hypothetical protein